MADELDTIIVGTILVYDQMDFILFYLGSSYSYVSIRFALVLILFFYVLESQVYVSTLIRDFLVVTHVYHAYSTLLIHRSSRFNHFGHALF